GFEKNFREIAGAAGTDLVEVDCSEPPCIAALRRPPKEDHEAWTTFFSRMRGTDVWKETYPEKVIHQGIWVDCDDGGRQEYVSFISLLPDDWEQQFAGISLDRRGDRARKIAADWECAPAR
ncbi:MAG: hypothetical protein JRI55_28855, partial [Deltaproteobacteria bacterium]|nr:hypothetical protein [Deltaproteobacteria bacterium]